jgi:hypothetical protein
MGTVYAGSDEFSGEIVGFKLPEYKKKSGKLEFVLYGEKAEKLGVSIKMENVLLDMVQDHIKDPSTIQDFSKLKVYPFKSKNEVIVDFWKTKNHTKCMIETTQAVFDEATRTINGNERIYFRSPSMDVNGVGFDADSENQIVIIRSKVKIILRSDLGSMKRDAKAKKKDKTVNKARK